MSAVFRWVCIGVALLEVAAALVLPFADFHVPLTRDAILGCVLMALPFMAILLGHIMSLRAPQNAWLLSGGLVTAFVWWLVMAILWYLAAGLVGAVIGACTLGGVATFFFVAGVRSSRAKAAAPLNRIAALP
jgi:hypothetical protein